MRPPTRRAALRALCTAAALLALLACTVRAATVTAGATCATAAAFASGDAVSMPAAATGVTVGCNVCGGGTLEDAAFIAYTADCTGFAEIATELDVCGGEDASPTGVRLALVPDCEDATADACAASGEVGSAWPPFTLDTEGSATSLVLRVEAGTAYTIAVTAPAPVALFAHCLPTPRVPKATASFDGASVLRVVLDDASVEDGLFVSRVFVGAQECRSDHNEAFLSEELDTCAEDTPRLWLEEYDREDLVAPEGTHFACLAPRSDDYPYAPGNLLDGVSSPCCDPHDLALGCASRGESLTLQVVIATKSCGSLCERMVLPLEDAYGFAGLSEDVFDTCGEDFEDVTAVPLTGYALGELTDLRRVAAGPALRLLRSMGEDSSLFGGSISFFGGEDFAPFTHPLERAFELVDRLDDQRAACLVLSLQEALFAGAAPSDFLRQPFAPALFAEDFGCTADEDLMRASLMYLQSVFGHVPLVESLPVPLTRNATDGTVTADMSRPARGGEFVLCARFAGDALYQPVPSFSEDDAFVEGLWETTVSLSIWDVNAGAFGEDNVLPPHVAVTSTEVSSCAANSNNLKLYLVPHGGGASCEDGFDTEDGTLTSPLELDYAYHTEGSFMALFTEDALGFTFNNPGEYHVCAAIEDGDWEVLDLGARTPGKQTLTVHNSLPLYAAFLEDDFEMGVKRQLDLSPDARALLRSVEDIVPVLLNDKSLASALVLDHPEFTFHHHAGSSVVQSFTSIAMQFVMGQHALCGAMRGDVLDAQRALSRVEWSGTAGAESLNITLLRPGTYALCVRYAGQASLVGDGYSFLFFASMMSSGGFGTLSAAAPAAAHTLASPSALAKHAAMLNKFAPPSALAKHAPVSAKHASALSAVGLGAPSLMKMPLFSMLMTTAVAGTWPPVTAGDDETEVMIAGFEFNAEDAFFMEDVELAVLVPAHMGCEEALEEYMEDEDDDASVFELASIVSPMEGLAQLRAVMSGIVGGHVEDEYTQPAPRLSPASLIEAVLTPVAPVWRATLFVNATADAFKRDVFGLYPEAFAVGSTEGTPSVPCGLDDLYRDLKRRFKHHTYTTPPNEYAVCLLRSDGLYTADDATLTVRGVVGMRDTSTLSSEQPIVIDGVRRLRNTTLAGYGLSQLVDLAIVPDGPDGYDCADVASPWGNISGIEVHLNNSDAVQNNVRTVTTFARAPSSVRVCAKFAGDDKYYGMQQWTGVGAVPGIIESRGYGGLSASMFVVNSRALAPHEVLYAVPVGQRCSDHTADTAPATSLFHSMRFFTSQRFERHQPWNRGFDFDDYARRLRKEGVFSRDFVHDLTATDFLRDYLQRFIDESSAYHAPEWQDFTGFVRFEGLLAGRYHVCLDGNMLYSGAQFDVNGITSTNPAFSAASATTVNLPVSVSVSGVGLSDDVEYMVLAPITTRCADIDTCDVSVTADSAVFSFPYASLTGSTTATLDRAARRLTLVSTVPGEFHVCVRFACDEVFVSSLDAPGALPLIVHGISTTHVYKAEAAAPLSVISPLFKPELGVNSSTLFLAPYGTQCPNAALSVNLHVSRSAVRAAPVGVTTDPALDDTDAPYRTPYSVDVVPLGSANLAPGKYSLCLVLSGNARSITPVASPAIITVSGLVAPPTVQTVQPVTAQPCAPVPVFEIAATIGAAVDATVDLSGVYAVPVSAGTCADVSAASCGSDDRAWSMNAEDAEDGISVLVSGVLSVPGPYHLCVTLDVAEDSEDHVAQYDELIFVPGVLPTFTFPETQAITVVSQELDSDDASTYTFTLVTVDSNNSEDSMSVWDMFSEDSVQHAFSAGAPLTNMDEDCEGAAAHTFTAEDVGFDTDGNAVLSLSNAVAALASGTKYAVCVSVSTEEDSPQHWLGYVTHADKFDFDQMPVVHEDTDDIDIELHAAHAPAAASVVYYPVQLDGLVPATSDAVCRVDDPFWFNDDGCSRAFEEAAVYALCAVTPFDPTPRFVRTFAATGLFSPSRVLTGETGTVSITMVGEDLNSGNVFLSRSGKSCSCKDVELSTACVGEDEDTGEYGYVFEVDMDGLQGNFDVCVSTCGYEDSVVAPGKVYTPYVFDEMFYPTQIPAGQDVDVYLQSNHVELDKVNITFIPRWMSCESVQPGSQYDYVVRVRPSGDDCEYDTEGAVVVTVHVPEVVPTVDDSCGTEGTTPLADATGPYRLCYQVRDVMCRPADLIDWDYYQEDDSCGDYYTCDAAVAFGDGEDNVEYYVNVNNIFTPSPPKRVVQFADEVEFELIGLNASEDIDAEDYAFSFVPDYALDEYDLDTGCGEDERPPVCDRAWLIDNDASPFTAINFRLEDNCGCATCPGEPLEDVVSPDVEDIRTSSMYHVDFTTRVKVTAAIPGRYQLCVSSTPSSRLARWDCDARDGPAPYFPVKNATIAVAGITRVRSESLLAAHSPVHVFVSGVGMYPHDEIVFVEAAEALMFVIQGGMDTSCTPPAELQAMFDTVCVDQFENAAGVEVLHREPIRNDAYGDYRFKFTLRFAQQGVYVPCFRAHNSTRFRAPAFALPPFRDIKNPLSLGLAVFANASATLRATPDVVAYAGGSLIAAGTAHVSEPFIAPFVTAVGAAAADVDDLPLRLNDTRFARVQMHTHCEDGCVFPDAGVPAMYGVFNDADVSLVVHKRYEDGEDMEDIEDTSDLLMRFFEDTYAEDFPIGSNPVAAGPGAVKRVILGGALPAVASRQRAYAHGGARLRLDLGTPQQPWQGALNGYMSHARVGNVDCPLLYDRVMPNITTVECRIPHADDMLLLPRPYALNKTTGDPIATLAGQATENPARKFLGTATFTAWSELAARKNARFAVAQAADGHAFYDQLIEIYDDPKLTAVVSRTIPIEAVNVTMNGRNFLPGGVVIIADKCSNVVGEPDLPISTIVSRSGKHVLSTAVLTNSNLVTLPNGTFNLVVTVSIPFTGDYELCVGWPQGPLFGWKTYAVLQVRPPTVYPGNPVTLRQGTFDLLITGDLFVTKGTMIVREQPCSQNLDFSLVPSLGASQSVSLSASMIALTRSRMSVPWTFNRPGTFYVCVAFTDDPRKMVQPAYQVIINDAIAAGQTSFEPKRVGALVSRSFTVHFSDVLNDLAMHMCLAPAAAGCTSCTESQFVSLTSGAGTTWRSSTEYPGQPAGTYAFCLRNGRAGEGKISNLGVVEYEERVVTDVVPKVFPVAREQAVTFIGMLDGLDIRAFFTDTLPLEVPQDDGVAVDVRATPKCPDATEAGITLSNVKLTSTGATASLVINRKASVGFCFVDTVRGTTVGNGGGSSSSSGASAPLFLQGAVIADLSVVKGARSSFARVGANSRIRLYGVALYEDLPVSFRVNDGFVDCDNSVAAPVPIVQRSVLRSGNELDLIVSADRVQTVRMCVAVDSSTVSALAAIEFIEPRVSSLSPSHVLPAVANVVFDVTVSGVALDNSDAYKLIRAGAVCSATVIAGDSHAYRSKSTSEDGTVAVVQFERVPVGQYQVCIMRQGGSSSVSAEHLTIGDVAPIFPDAIKDNDTHGNIALSIAIPFIVLGGIALLAIVGVVVFKVRSRRGALVATQPLVDDNSV